MQYKIEHLYHKIDEEFGNNDLCFYCDFVFSAPEALTISEYFIPDHLIRKYIEQHYPDFDKYIDRVLTSLDTWGPHTGLTFENLGDEGQHLYYKYAEEYLLQADWIESFYEQQKDNPWHQEMTAAKHAELEEKLEDLGSMASDIKKSTNRSVEFKTKVQRMVRQIAMEVYPEIMDASPEQLKTFRHIFVSDVMRMEDSLEEFLEELEEEEEE